MCHDHHPDRPSGEPPRCLVSELLFMLLRLELDTEHLREVLTQVVGGSGLDGPAVGRDKTLDGGGHLASSEFLLFRLDPLGHRHCQHIFVDGSVEVQDLEDHFLTLLVGGVGSVPFLPQELARADKRSGLLELPTHHRGPLVQLQGKVAVGPNPLGERGVHDGLRGRANSNGLSHLRSAISCDPRNLRGKSLYVVLFRLQSPLGDEQRKIRVLYAQLLDLTVKPLLDLLPNEESPGSEDVAAGHLIVLDHLRTDNHLGVPLRKVILLLNRDPLSVLITICLRCSFRLGLGLGFRLRSGLGLRLGRRA
mmetsp:Transcript_36659/g.77819  ORF Transcript_36659/g.77819 Transcript_36659/m.77819 type:complete len:307 (+) Transcript_36659:821-1741(+)